MDYLTIKTIHLVAVALSFLGFFARGVGAMLGSDWVRSRVSKTIPHVVDTVLLASAVLLAWQAAINPLSAPWLMAKLGGLVLYVLLGMVALRSSTPLPLRTGAWLLALASFGYIVSVAITKHPAGFFLLLTD